MKKVLRIDEYGLFVADEMLKDNEVIPPDCVETQCPDGFYMPKWNGTEWIEGLSQEEIDAIKATQPVDIKAQAIEEINSATTIAGLKAAMLKFIEAS